MTSSPPTDLDNFLFGVVVFLVIIVMLVGLRLSRMLVVRRSCVLLAGLFGARRVLGMGRVFFRVLGVDTLVMGVFFANLGCSGCFGGLDGRRDRHVGMRFRHRRVARGMTVIVLAMCMVMGMIVAMVVIMRMIVRMIVACMIVMPGIGVVMFNIVRVAMAVVRVLAFMCGVVMRLRGARGVGAGVVDDLALHPLAAAAAALVAVARTAATVAGAVLGFFLGLAMGAFVGLDQRLTVGDRNLIIVGMDFAEGQEAMAIAAIFDEGRLQRRFYARDLGEVDIAAQLFALGGFEIKLLDAIAADHDDTGLFRVGSIDQHFVGHFATHDGGGRV